MKNKKIMLIILIFTFVLSNSIITFASTLVEGEFNDFPLTDTNAIEICGIKQYYWAIKHTGGYCILLSDVPIQCNGSYYYIPSGSMDIYYYNSDTNQYEFEGTNTNNNTPLFGTSTVLDMYYGNYSISDFFLKTPLKELSIKGVTKTMIVTKTLSGIVSLIPLVTGCIISVIAFRKGWVMLKTILLGA